MLAVDVLFWFEVDGGNELRLSNYQYDSTMCFLHSVHCVGIRYLSGLFMQVCYVKYIHACLVTVHYIAFIRLLLWSATAIKTIFYV